VEVFKQETPEDIRARVKLGQTGRTLEDIWFNAGILDEEWRISE
jgi:hypothetical protein